MKGTDGWVHSLQRKRQWAYVFLVIVLFNAAPIQLFELGMFEAATWTDYGMHLNQTYLSSSAEMRVAKIFALLEKDLYII